MERRYKLRNTRTGEEIWVPSSEWDLIEVESDYVPVCSQPYCYEPATMMYVGARAYRKRVKEIRYPRCKKHPLKNAIRMTPLHGV